MDLDPSILSQLDWGNTDDHSSRTKIVNIVVISTTFTIVSIRTLIRLSIIRRLGLDDIIIIFAALFQIAFSAEVLYGLQFGLGKHVWLTASSLEEIIPHVRQIVEVMFFANMTYFTSITLVKVSIITCYIRVFPNTAMRWTCGILGFVIISTWICSILTTIFTCSKISDQWEFDNVDRKCIAIIPYYYFAAGVNTFTDLALTIAPVPLLLRIKVSTREKFILCVLFGMGLFAGACSIVRLLSLRNLYTADISFGSSDTLDWSSIELGVGIFCACIPSLKPLLGGWARRDTLRSRGRPSGPTQPRSTGTKGFEMLTTSEATPKLQMTKVVIGHPQPIHSPPQISPETPSMDKEIALTPKIIQISPRCQFVMARSPETPYVDEEKHIGMAM